MAMFIRATKVKPFTVELKNACANRCIALLNEFKTVYSLEQKREIMIRIYTTLMEYPEFLAKYHKFRATAENKVIQHILELHTLNLPRSQVMEDFVDYLSILKMRSDYVNTPSHRYNLRPRK